MFLPCYIRVFSLYISMRSNTHPKQQCSGSAQKSPVILTFPRHHPRLSLNCCVTEAPAVFTVAIRQELHQLIKWLNLLIVVTEHTAHSGYAVPSLYCKPVKSVVLPGTAAHDWICRGVIRDVYQMYLINCPVTETILTLNEGTEGHRMIEVELCAQNRQLKLLMFTIACIEMHPASNSDWLLSAQPCSQISPYRGLVYNNIKSLFCAFFLFLKNFFSDDS